MELVVIKKSLQVEWKDIFIFLNFTPDLFFLMYIHVDSKKTKQLKM